MFPRKWKFSNLHKLPNICPNHNLKNSLQFIIKAYKVRILDPDQNPFPTIRPINKQIKKKKNNYEHRSGEGAKKGEREIEITENGLTSSSSKGFGSWWRFIDSCFFFLFLVFFLSFRSLNFAPNFANSLTLLLVAAGAVRCCAFSLQRSPFYLRLYTTRDISCKGIVITSFATRILNYYV